MPLSKGANERIWDAVIKESLIESMKSELDEAEQNAEPHSFSPQFEHNMKKLSRSIGIKEKSRFATNRRRNFKNIFCYLDRKSVV